MRGESEDVGVGNRGGYRLGERGRPIGMKSMGRGGQRVLNSAFATVMLVLVLRCESGDGASLPSRILFSSMTSSFCCRGYQPCGRWRRLLGSNCPRLLVLALPTTPASPRTLARDSPNFQSPLRPPFIRVVLPCPPSLSHLSAPSIHQFVPSPPFEKVHPFLCCKTSPLSSPNSRRRMDAEGLVAGHCVHNHQSKHTRKDPYDNCWRSGRLPRRWVVGGSEKGTAAAVELAEAVEGGEEAGRPSGAGEEQSVGEGGGVLEKGEREHAECPQVESCPHPLKQQAEV